MDDPWCSDYTKLYKLEYKTIANGKGDATSFLVDGMADCSEVSDDTESSRATNGVPRSLTTIVKLLNCSSE